MRFKLGKSAAIHALWVTAALGVTGISNAGSIDVVQSGVARTVPFKIATVLAPRLAATAGIDLDSAVAFGAAPAAAVSGIIRYSPSLGLGDQDRLEFELTNGLFIDSTYVLVRENGTPGQSVGDLVSTVGASGASKLEFRITQSVLAGDNLVLANVANSTPVNEANPDTTVSFKSSSVLTSGGEISIAVVNARDTGGNLDGANAAATAVIELAAQYVFTIDSTLGASDGAVVSVIDANQGRKTFVSGIGTTSTSSAVSLIVDDSTAGLDDFFFMGDAGSATLTLTSNGGLGGINIASDSDPSTYGGLNLETGVTADELTATSIAPTTDGILSGGPIGGALGSVITLNVDGTTPLETRTFTGAFSLLFDNTDITSFGDVPLGDTHIWDINGYQATLPYVTRVGFLRIANTSSQSAEVFMSATDREGSMVELSGSFLDPIAKKTSATIFLYKIVNDALAKGLVGDRFVVTLTVATNSSQVFTTGIYVAGGQERELTIYDNNNVSFGK